MLVSLTVKSMVLISTIILLSGVYAIKPPLPAVGGGEGVGVVRGRGQAVTSLEEGDWVVPAVMSLGQFAK